MNTRVLDGGSLRIANTCLRTEPSSTSSIDHSPSPALWMAMVILAVALILGWL